MAGRRQTRPEPPRHRHRDEHLALASQVDAVEPRDRRVTEEQEERPHVTRPRTPTEPASEDDDEQGREGVADEIGKGDSRCGRARPTGARRRSKDERGRLLIPGIHVRHATAPDPVRHVHVEALIVAGRLHQRGQAQRDQGRESRPVQRRAPSRADVGLGLMCRSGNTLEL